MDIISIFNQIRDIPYNIPVSLKEEDFCCSGKNKILKKALEKEGYKVRYRICSFLWASSIDLPQKVLDVPHEVNNTHAYLEVLFKNKWVIVDPTWDIGLKNIFPINEWNLNKNNKIAVKPIKNFSLKKSADIMNSEDEQGILDDLKINGKFYKAINNWLSEIRKEN